MLLTLIWTGYPEVFRSEASDVRWLSEILCAIVEDVPVVSEWEWTAFRRNDGTGSVHLTLWNKRMQFVKLSSTNLSGKRFEGKLVLVIFFWSLGKSLRLMSTRVVRSPCNGEKKYWKFLLSPPQSVPNNKKKILIWIWVCLRVQQRECGQAKKTTVYCVDSRNVLLGIVSSKKLLSWSQQVAVRLKVTWIGFRAGENLHVDLKKFAFF